jgi:hypothetical protein
MMVSDKGRREEVDDQQLRLIGQQRTMTTSPLAPISGSMTSNPFLIQSQYLPSICVTCFSFEHAFRLVSRMQVRWSGGQPLFQRLDNKQGSWEWLPCLVSSSSNNNFQLNESGARHIILGVRSDTLCQLSASYNVSTSLHPGIRRSRNLLSTEISLYQQMSPKKVKLRLLLIIIIII